MNKKERFYMNIKNAVLQGYSDRISEAGGAVKTEAQKICRMACSFL